MQSMGSFCLGPYHIIVDEQAVILFDERCTVQPKVMELLSILAKQYPTVVSRNELIELLWAGNEAVGEKALTNTIWQLRQLFANEQAPIKVVDTIRKKGYKLSLAPEFIEPSTSNPLIRSSSPKTQPNLRRYIILSVLACCVVAWVVLNTHTSSILKHGNTITEITKMPGSELRPTPSPNGDKLVFVWKQANQTAQLFLKDLSQPDLPLRQLTFTNKQPWKAVWSPDQAYLYFAQKDDKECEIVRLSLNDLAQVKLASCPINSGYNYIAISPDGKTLAFNGRLPEHDNDGLYFLNLGDSTDPSALVPKRFSCIDNCDARDRDIAFSPDGKWLAVSQRVSSSIERLVLFNTHNNTYEVLDERLEDIVGMSFHPDGKRLVYGAQIADKRIGFVIDITTKARQMLTHRGFSFPHFDKLGHLYFQKRRENYFIASFESETNVVSMPSALIESHYSNQYPTFSNHVQKLAFLSNESGFYELWLADPDGTNREQLTHLKRNLRYPSFSLDGSKLLIVSSEESDGNDKLYIFDAATKELKRIDLMFGKIGRPVWHGNGMDIVIRFQSDSGYDLYTINLDTLTLTQLTDSGGRYGQFIDEHTFLYTDGKGLWQKTESGKAPVLPRSEFNTRYSWFATTSAIYFKHINGQYSEIKRYDLTEKSLQTLLRLPADSFSKEAPLVFNPTLNTLLFTQSLSQQSDILQIEL